MLISISDTNKENHLFVVPGDYEDSNDSLLTKNELIGRNNSNDDLTMKDENEPDCEVISDNVITGIEEEVSFARKEMRSIEPILIYI